MHGVWITGGVVYGEPESGTYPQQKQHNEELIHHVANQVCHLHQGPRFLAGDWNCEQHTLPPVFAMIEAAGFCDLQDLARDLWGRPVVNTCKQATRKDFCYVSRELQQLLVSVSLQHDVFPDHSVLVGEFASPKQALPRQVWTSPGECPWPQQWNVDPCFWSSLQDTPDEKYQKLWHHIEQQASAALPYPVHQRVKGRAAVRTVKPKFDGKIPPPKQARKGDIRPHYVCASFRHSQWLRQLRRPQAYVRHVGAQDSMTSYAAQVWGSAIRATGFTPFVTGGVTAASAVLGLWTRFRWFHLVSLTLRPFLNHLPLPLGLLRMTCIRLPDTMPSFGVKRIRMSFFKT
jgi:hypothetical protein